MMDNVVRLIGFAAIAYGVGLVIWTLIVVTRSSYRNAGDDDS